MRNLLSSLLFTGLTGTLLLGSCGFLDSEEDVKSVERDSTYFRATLNGGEKWSADPRGVFVDNGGEFDPMLSISGDTVHQNKFPYTEELIIFVNSKGERNYDITRTKHEIDGNPLITGSDYCESDGDVILTHYLPTGDSSANQLTITSYDTTSGMMEGTFRTTVVVTEEDVEPEPGEPPRRRPDTLRFTNGTFRVEVDDRRDQ